MENTSSLGKLEYDVAFLLAHEEMKCGKSESK